MVKISWNDHLRKLECLRHVLVDSVFNPRHALAWRSRALARFCTSVFQFLFSRVVSSFLWNLHRDSSILAEGKIVQHLVSHLWVKNLVIVVWRFLS